MIDANSVLSLIHGMNASSGSVLSVLSVLKVC